MTVMGDAPMERLSDAGSIPARSIRKAPCLRRFFYFMLHFVLHRFKMRIDLLRKLFLFV